ncbi:MAG: PorP/SprF family type IX secretion system membrane protein, partial [Bacteroidota bacterium]|nr:PorP/SprF family type IX secretion system membrane protein [Bacteroidota bacterium]
MKQLYRQLFLIACCVQMAVASFGQDMHFSQFFEAPLYRNPALAGLVNGDVRVQTVYRSQWNSIANAYKTTSLNAEYKLQVTGDDFVTVGAQVFHDKAGTTNLTTTHLLPAINYHKSLNTEKNMYLSVGFMGGLVQRRIDRSRMTTNSTYDGHGDGESEMFQSQYSYFDGSTGMSVSAQLNDNPENTLVGGAAYHHFTKPKNSFFNDQTVLVPAKMVVSVDAKLQLSEQLTSTFYNDLIKQGAYREIITGGLIGYKIGPYSDEPDAVLRLGGFYRWGDAFIPVAQLDYRPFSVSLSYDVNLSKLSPASYGKGGYELSVTYAGFLNRDNSSANAVQ